MHYLDVGQSDCTFVEIGGDYTLMIDASDEAHAERICRYIENLGYSRIDLLVLTHPHSDHIGGAHRVLAEFEVGIVYMTETEASGEDAEYLRRVEEIIEESDIERVLAEAGVTFELGRLQGKFLSPMDVSFEDENEMSAVISLRWGEQRFLFMGDAGEAAEKLLIERGADLRADVVKAGHHGSGGSSSRDFVSATGADYVVFSCGAGNDYGHPSPYAADRWANAGAQIFRTDRDCTVIACTDGANIAVVRLSECDLFSEDILWDFGTQISVSSVNVNFEYVLNTSAHTVHLRDCSAVIGQEGEHLEQSSQDIERLAAEGYKLCTRCLIE